LGRAIEHGARLLEDASIELEDLGDDVLRAVRALDVLVHRGKRVTGDLL
jgi:hypothetical protein